MKYLHRKQLHFIHARVIEETGGSAGIRDERLLDAAIFRPQGTFGGQDLYPTLFEKAAALGHSLIKNHPFVDGNKRVGWVAMQMFLKINGYELRLNTDSIVEFVLKIAENKESINDIAEFLKQHSAPLS